MKDHYIVIYSPKMLASFPLWGCGGISDAYVVWKSDGVLAALLYLFFHAETSKASTWAMTVPKFVTQADLDAREKTREWLTRHEFPSELIEAFEKPNTSGSATVGSASKS